MIFFFVTWSILLLNKKLIFRVKLRIYIQDILRTFGTNSALVKKLPQFGHPAALCYHKLQPVRLFLSAHLSLIMIFSKKHYATDHSGHQPESWKVIFIFFRNDTSNLELFFENDAWTFSFTKVAVYYEQYHLWNLIGKLSNIRYY